MVADANRFVVSIGRLVIFGCCYISNSYVPIAPFLVSKTQVGVLLSAQAFAGCAALIPAGLAIDRLGPKPVLQWATQAALLGLVLGAMSGTFFVQLLARLVLGATLSANFNAMMALIMERYQEPQRAAFLGSALGLGSVGNVVGPPLMGIIFDFAKQHALPMPYFWALVHPVLLLLLILWLLQWVPEKVSSETGLCDPLVTTPEPHSTTASEGWLRKAFAVYLAAGAPAVMLALELVAIFGCCNAFLTAGATELHRQGFSSSSIGLAAVPSAIARVLASQWAGRYAGEAQRRSAVLAGTPLIYAVLVLLVAALCAGATPPPVILVLMLVLSCVANATVDAPSMSLMASLASAQQLGYGQAVTASELAVALGLALGPMMSTVVLHHGSYALLCLLASSVAFLVGLGALREFVQTAK